MVKKEKGLYARSVLEKKEFQEYQKQKKAFEREKYLNKLKTLKREATLARKQREYAASGYGKAGARISKAASFLRSPSGFLYARSQPVFKPEKKTISGRSTGRPGRPRGSYKQLYAAYGGVYGYRKALALENFKRRQEILQARAITPQQQMILQQIKSREQAQRMSPESHVFPDTTGDVDMNNIFQEIDEVSNIAG